MEDEENWWALDHLSEESESSKEQNPPNELLPESIGREKTDSNIEETSSVIEEVFNQQEYPAQSGEKGFLGFSWLTRGEAITFIVMFILAFSFVVGGILRKKCISSEACTIWERFFQNISVLGNEIYARLRSVFLSGKV